MFNGYVVRITGDTVVFQETVQDKLGKAADAGSDQENFHAGCLAWATVLRESRNINKIEFQ